LTAQAIISAVKKSAQSEKTGMLTNIARILVTLGVMLVLVGGLLYLADRLGLPLGRLPGDIRLGNGNLTCFIPLATSLILSVVLTILLNVIIRLLR
jgi:hypothetical protein